MDIDLIQLNDLSVRIVNYSIILQYENYECYIHKFPLYFDSLEEFKEFLETETYSTKIEADTITLFYQMKVVKKSIPIEFQLKPIQSIPYLQKEIKKLQEEIETIKIFNKLEIEDIKHINKELLCELQDIRHRKEIKKLKEQFEYYKNEVILEMYSYKNINKELLCELQEVRDEKEFDLLTLCRYLSNARGIENVESLYLIDLENHNLYFFLNKYGYSKISIWIRDFYVKEDNLGKIKKFQKIFDEMYEKFVDQKKEFLFSLFDPKIRQHFDFEQLEDSWNTDWDNKKKPLIGFVFIIKPSYWINCRSEKCIMEFMLHFYTISDLIRRIEANICQIIRPNDYFLHEHSYRGKEIRTIGNTNPYGIQMIPSWLMQLSPYKDLNS
jgi:hypothetical protein